MLQYSFPPDLTNTDRRYVHTCCKNLNLASKSTGGGKGSSTRYIVVYKGDKGPRPLKQLQAVGGRKHPLSTLAFNAAHSIPLVDGFLQAYPLPVDAAAPAAQQSREDAEVDLAALVARYTPRKSVAEVATLSAHLRQLQMAREAAEAATSSGLSELQTFRRKLPIYAQRDTILKLIDENPVLVLSSSTGSGQC